MPVSTRRNFNFWTSLPEFPGSRPCSQTAIAVPATGSITTRVRSMNFRVTGCVSTILVWGYLKKAELPRAVWHRTPPCRLAQVLCNITDRLCLPFLCLIIYSHLFQGLASTTLQQTHGCMPRTVLELLSRLPSSQFLPRYPPCPPALTLAALARSESRPPILVKLRMCS